ncbi:MAG: ABC transporter permease subunit [Firmicutes bacterium]|nr:ABC transporter permease subunit [Bacillota bacterium]
MKTLTNATVRSGAARDFIKKLNSQKLLILMILPACVYFFVFHYIPIYGIIVAFKDFSISSGILGSRWVGLKWFYEFFNSYVFWRLLRNTLMLNVYNLMFGFPVPIIFALLLNEIKGKRIKRTIQTISYLPHFISVVIVVSIMNLLLSTTGGVVNKAVAAFGIEPINFMYEKSWFRFLYVFSAIWQNFGWNSIIYFAAIANINKELYEAATIDGANRWKQTLYITIPGILPTIGIMLLLRLGSLMSVGFEKIILMYNPSTYEVSDVISTYVYRKGLLASNFSFGAAVGFFNSVINFIILVASNYISNKLSGDTIGLW